MAKRNQEAQVEALPSARKPWRIVCTHANGMKFSGRLSEEDMIGIQELLFPVSIRNPDVLLPES